MPMLDSYIFFDGNCAQAMRFYERVTGGKLLTMLKYADSPVPIDPAHCAPTSLERVMHACLQIDGRNLMASDTPEGQFKPMQGFSLSLYYETAEEAKKKFEMFADGGQVMMPFAPTFWAKGFGMCVDKFGTPWMVMGGSEMPPPKG